MNLSVAGKALFDGPTRIRIHRAILDRGEQLFSFSSRSFPSCPSTQSQKGKLTQEGLFLRARTGLRSTRSFLADAHSEHYRRSSRDPDSTGGDGGG
jgi:hypothetical protein